MLEKEEYIIDRFIFHGGMNKLVKDLKGTTTGLKYKREEFPRKSPIDVLAEDINGNVFVFELYYTLPSISNLLQKIKTRKIRKYGKYKDIKFVAIIPHNSLSDYGPHLVNEDIIVAYWDETTAGQVSFGISRAYQKTS